MKAKTRWRIEFLIGKMIGFAIVLYWLSPYIQAAAHYLTSRH